MSAQDTLARRFTESFPKEPCTWRTIGREAEFPVVDAEGRAARVPRILATLASQLGLQPRREGDLVIGVAAPHWEAVLEVGLGTIELITGPEPDLHILGERHAAGLAAIVAAAEEHGARILGFGTQPLSPATEALMSPKAHYRQLLASLGPGWLWFTQTASDQVHIDISRGELWELANLGNLLAPLTVALMANSSIYAGAEGPVASGRELGMGTIGASAGRHGMPLAPTRDSRDFVDSLVPQPYLIEWREGRKVATSRTFAEHLASAPQLSEDQLWRDFLLHEHYVWHSARPRTAQATLELRAACQQPHEDEMVAAALGLGIVCAGPQLARVLADELGDAAWPAMRRWHHEAVRHGLAAEEPTPGLSGRLLACMAAALDDRGRGEARFLEPLVKRLGTRRSPAQEARELIDKRGLEAFLAARCAT